MHGVGVGSLSLRKPLIHQARSANFASVNFCWELMCRHHLIALHPDPIPSHPLTSAHIASRRTNPFRDDLTAAVFLNFAVPSIKADPMLPVYAI
ncbi:GD24335 [Drosophila simulans]|uniref:GD24335 n=1 Tax=Drosophila simulans TaxID=7240 RepID=B4Q4G6_DROSI|nr:GD24335 [Drosophila simulans]